jgi:hypothetical protein
MANKRGQPMQRSVSAVFEEISGETILSAAASGQGNPILVRKSRVNKGTAQGTCTPTGGPLLLMQLGNNRVQVWKLANEVPDISPCDTTVVFDKDGNDWELAQTACFLINDIQYTTNKKGMLQSSTRVLDNLLSWNEIGKQ